MGGGKVAERKCSALIGAGARVTVVSPVITRRLERYNRQGLLRHIGRGYRKGDIASAFAVIAATDSEETNKKVAADAAGRNILLNVADSPSLCNFISPSVLKRGALTIAVSTGGVSPAMAGTIRKELGKLYGPEFSKYLVFLRGVRKRAMAKVRDSAARQELLKDLSSERLLGILRGRGFRQAKRAALSIWDKFRI